MLIYTYCGQQERCHFILLLTLLKSTYANPGSPLITVIIIIIIIIIIITCQCFWCCHHGKPLREHPVGGAVRTAPVVCQPPDPAVTLGPGVQPTIIFAVFFSPCRPLAMFGIIASKSARPSRSCDPARKKMVKKARRSHRKSNVIVNKAPAIAEPWYYYSATADTHVTVPLRVEGWVDLGTAVMAYSPCPRLFITVVFAVT